MNAQTKIKFLALGDSYTIGESVGEAERWPNQLIDSLRKQGHSADPPTIIATTGWRTDDLKQAVIKANPKNEYTMVSLLIGVNNQYQGKSAEQYAIEFEDLLETAVRLGGGIPERVFIVSIPDYGYTPFGRPRQEQISRAIDQFNAVNSSIARKKGIRYIDITDISRRGLAEPDLIAADGLHPSGKMYSLWVQRIIRDR